jgi:hypothetical protein
VRRRADAPPQKKFPQFPTISPQFLSETARGQREDSARTSRGRAVRSRNRQVSGLAGGAGDVFLSGDQLINEGFGRFEERTRYTCPVDYRIVPANTTVNIGGLYVPAGKMASRLPAL